MSALLVLLVLAARDEATELIEKLRAAPEAEQARIAAQLPGLVKAEHLPQLSSEIDAGPAALRPHFIRAIARVGGEEASALLRDLVQRYDLPSRAEAAGQLAILKDPAGPKALIALLPHASSDAEKSAVLRQMRGAPPADSADAVPALDEFLRKESPDDLRRMAVQVLASCGNAAVPSLRLLAGDAKEPARFTALNELIRRGDAAAVEEGLKSLEERKVDLAALPDLTGAIASVNNPAAAPRLRALLESAQDRALKLALLRALTALKDEASVPLITRLGQDPDPGVANVAQESIVRLGVREKSETIKKAAAVDAEPLKKLDAAEALLLADSPEGWPALKAALAGGNTTVRYRALTILSQLRRREGIDLLVPMLEDPTDSVRSLARSTMISTLAALYPYQKFDAQAPADKLKTWWEKNRGR